MQNDFWHPQKWVNIYVAMFQVPLDVKWKVDVMGCVYEVAVIGVSSQRNKACLLRKLLPLPSQFMLGWSLTSVTSCMNWYMLLDFLHCLVALNGMWWRWRNFTFFHCCLLLLVWSDVTVMSLERSVRSGTQPHSLSGILYMHRVCRPKLSVMEQKGMFGQHFANVGEGSGQCCCHGVIFCCVMCHGSFGQVASFHHRCLGSVLGHGWTSGISATCCLCTSVVLCQYYHTCAPDSFFHLSTMVYVLITIDIVVK